jgi:hypothetical protein
MTKLILFEESTRLIDNLERTHGFQRALVDYAMFPCFEIWNCTVADLCFVG